MNPREQSQTCRWGRSPLDCFRHRLTAFGMLVSLSGCVVSAGCGRHSDATETIAQRVEVRGSVLLDGKPLEAGAIVFFGPLDSEGASAVTAYAYVEGGRYRIDSTTGPVVGMARVEFRPKPLSREELEASLDQAVTGRRRMPTPTVVDIPAKYGQESELRVQLIGGRVNEHDFALTSRS